MSHRTQTLGFGSLALLCALASSGCQDIEDAQTASEVSSGQSSRLQTDNVVFEPSMGTMSLRPEIDQLADDLTELWLSTLPAG